MGHMMPDAIKAEMLASRQTTNIMILMLAYDNDFFLKKVDTDLKSEQLCMCRIEMCIHVEGSAIWM